MKVNGSQNKKATNASERDSARGASDTHEGSSKTESTAPVEYRCDCCPYRTFRNADLRRHIFKIHEGGQRKKHFSPAAYGSAAEVEAALRCRQGRNLPLQLTEEEARFLEDGKSKCRDCGYESPKRSDLVRHIRCVHLRIRDYSCHLCSYTCFGSSTLGQHIKSIHLRIKDHACKLCDYKASRRADINKHLRFRHKIRVDEIEKRIDYFVDYRGVEEETELKKQKKGKVLAGYSIKSSVATFYGPQTKLPLPLFPPLSTSVRSTRKRRRDASSPNVTPERILSNDKVVKNEVAAVEEDGDEDEVKVIASVGRQTKPKELRHIDDRVADVSIGCNDDSTRQTQRGGGDVSTDTDEKDAAEALEEILVEEVFSWDQHDDKTSSCSSGTKRIRHISDSTDTREVEVVKEISRGPNLNAVASILRKNDLMKSATPFALLPDDGDDEVDDVVDIEGTGDGEKGCAPAAEVLKDVTAAESNVGKTESKGRRRSNKTPSSKIGAGSNCGPESQILADSSTSTKTVTSWAGRPTKRKSAAGVLKTVNAEKMNSEHVDITSFFGDGHSVKGTKESMLSSTTVSAAAGLKATTKSGRTEVVKVGNEKVQATTVPPTVFHGRKIRRQISAITGLKCHVCSYSCDNRTHLMQHFERIHMRRGGEGASPMEFRCAHCTYVTSLKVILKSHIITIHTK